MCDISIYNLTSIELQQEKSDPDDQAVFIGHDSMATSFFPSISLVNSMPVRADQIMQIANSMGWETVSKGGRRLDDRVKSAKPRIRKRFMNRWSNERYFVQNIDGILKHVLLLIGQHFLIKMVLNKAALKHSL